MAAAWITYDDDYRDFWQDIALHHSGSLYHDIRWKDVIAETYGLEANYVLLISKGSMTGILPLFFAGKKMISLPYLSWGGIACKESVDFDTILQRGFLNRKELIIKEKSHHPDWNWAGYVTMITSLPGDIEHFFQSLSSKQRNMVRSAGKNPFRLVRCSVNDFYPLYTRATNALGTPPHHKRLFESIANHFQDNLLIHRLELHGKPAGVIMEIDYGKTRYDLWAFSFKAYFPHKPNVYMYWHRLMDAIERGMQYYDFGRSLAGSGTYHFKRKWNAQPYPLIYKSIKVNKGNIETTHLEPRTPGFASKLWSRLPQSIANRLGPYLRKYVF